jgi:acyl-CoA synthetase (AMP-forming)/AMP-acid ligase II
MQAAEIAVHFGKVPTLEPESVAIRFEGKEFTWGELDAVANGILTALRDAGVPQHSAIGWLARNDPALVAALVGILKGEYCVSPLNPHQPATKIAEQIRNLKMAATVGVSRDFIPEVRTVLQDAGALGLMLEIGAAVPVRLCEGVDKLGPGPFLSLGEDIVIERLTSGTTGEPKRIQVPSATFIKAMQLGARSEKGGKPDELIVKRSAAIVQTTFSHSGGMWAALLALNQARPIDLHERFTPEAWSGAVERTQTRAANLVPSMITMVLDAKIPPEKLRNGGTGSRNPAAV